METYQEKRQKVVNELRNENKALVELSLKNANNIKNAYESLSESLKNILSLEDELTMSSERIKKTKNSAAGLRVLDRVRDFTGTTSTVDTQRSNNAHLKKSIQSQELKLKSINGFILNGFKEGARSVRSSVSFRSDYAPAISCESRLREVVASLEENDLLDSDKFFNVLKSLETKQAVKSLEDLIDLLGGYKPAVPTEHIRMRALVNMQSLCAHLSDEKSAKIEYLNSLEGRVLAYVTYLNAAKREEVNQNIDETYLSFLQSRADDKLATLSLESYETIKAGLESLVDEDLLSQDDLTYTLVRIKKDYEKNAPGETATESAEDIMLRALILEEDFEVSAAQSFATAKMIRDGDIKRVYAEIADVIGSHKAKILVKQNPNLFLLDNGNVTRYTSYLKEVINKARIYSGAGDAGIREFGLEDNPGGFSSFEGLHDTMRKISNLEAMGNERTGGDYLKDSSLGPDERRKIKDAFRNWDGIFTTEQKKIIDANGLYLDVSGRHYKIRAINMNYFVTTSKSPSDWRTGRNFATSILDLIEMSRKRGYSGLKD